MGPADVPYGSKCTAHYFEEVVDVAVAADADLHAGFQNFGDGGDTAAHLTVGQGHGHGAGAGAAQDIDLLLVDLHHLRGQDVFVQHTQFVMVQTGCFP